MNKTILILSGIVLLVLNGGMFVCPYEPARLITFGVSGIAGLALLALAFRPAKEPAVRPRTDATVAPPPAPPPSPPRPEAEIVAFLALLQEHGRLVDFVREDIAGAEDAQLGAAARVIHAGCRKVISEYFEIERVHAAEEGQAVELPAGYDAPAYRLLGTVPEQPPYRGTLLHPGWKATAVKLPRVTGTTPERPWPVIAPAEVQIK